MKQTKSIVNMIRIGVGVITLIVAGVFYIPTLFDSGSESVAKNIQKAVPVLSSFSVGDVRLDSIREYYANNVGYIQDDLDNKEQYATQGYTEEDFAAWEAEMEISRILAEKIPDTVETKADSVSGAFVGTDDGQEVRGIFVYEFKDGAPITKELAEKANTSSYELYYVKGNYVITIEYQFLQGNNLSQELIFEAANNAIK